MGLERLSLLRPHEEALPYHVKEVMESISKSKVVMKPLLVEAKTNIILDGMHRYEALRLIGAELAPVVKVDYSKVELVGWARVYEYREDMLSVLLQLSKSYRVKGRSAVVFLADESSYYDIKKLEEEGLRLIKVVTRPAMIDGSIVVVPPLPTKDLVKSAAETGNLLPARSTRHITIAKRIYLPTPLKELL